MKIRHSLLITSLLMALAASVGCTGTTTTGAGNAGGAGPAETTPEGKTVSSVDLDPSKATLTKGTSLQYHATAKFADGTTEDVTRNPDTVWNTSEPTVATVSKTGLVTALKEGLANITAEYKGQKGQDHFIVTP